MAGKGVVRSIKNIAKGFSDVQIKVREATSNDPWGPSGTLMNEIAQLTFNESDFIEIMDMIDKRLNDKGKNWRHVFKALLLLDYCLHVGSENVVLYAKENIYVVKTLKEFQHLEENGKDVGANVRQKAKDITNLLTDDNRLQEERRQRQGMRDRMANIHDYLSESVRRIDGEEDSGRTWDDENELKKALAESKRIAAEEEKNRKQGDDDLEKALQISQQEALEKEQKKREQLEKENAQNLFGSSSSAFGTFPQQNTMPMNNPYQQPQLQLEWTQQPTTGFNTNQFSEPFVTGVNPYAAQQQQQQNNPYATAGLQAQMTGFPASTGSVDFFSQQQQQQPQLQAQMTGFQQPIQQFQQQNQFLQPQPQPQAQFQTSMVTGTNPFSQMSSQQQTLQPQQPVQHDYSSLVFGTPQQVEKVASPLFAPAAAQTPSFSFTSTNNNSNAFGSASSPSFAHTTPFNTTSNAFQPSPKPASPVVSEHDNKYAKLNALLANKDDGMDNFGNQGNLRIPYGTGFAGSLKLTPNNAAAAADNSFGTTNKNPFGNMTDSPKLQAQQQQKSLLDLMQEQKAQQQQQQQLFF